MAVAVLVLATSACSSAEGPRQADRTQTADPHIPSVEEPGTPWIAETGVVTEQFRVSGSVQAFDTTALTVPYPALITSNPPRVGTDIEEGDVLFAYAPSQVARAVATEYEAAAYARTHGTGDRDEREARFEEARVQAEAMGIPVDDPSALPLPDEIEVLSPLTGVVLRSTNAGTNQVAAGSVVVEVGRGEDLYVAGTATEPVAVLLGIGSVVTVTAGDLEAEALINRIDYPMDSPQVVTLLLDSEITVDEEVVIDHAGDGQSENGVVVESSGDEDSGWAVLVEVPDPAFAFLDSVDVASRRDLDNVVAGRLESVEHVAASESSMTISIPEGALPFNESVRVTLFGASRSNVLWLPPEAIRTFDGIGYVIVEEDGVRARVDVVIGLRSDDRIEVIGELSEGDTVIVR